jgi:hypothetical protein
MVPELRVVLVGVLLVLVLVLPPPPPQADKRPETMRSERSLD